MSLSAISFLQPLILVALAFLPLIWWLLRFTPPRPAEVAFPAVRLLMGLHANEETPARSPWWLTALRMLIAALIILALAGPVINPQGEATAVSRKLLIVVDNGWAAASRWPQHQAMLDAALQQADSHGQTVSIVATASLPAEKTLQAFSPATARQKAAGLEPQPYSPSRQNAARMLSAVKLGSGSGQGYDVVWLADGVDTEGAADLTEELRRLSAGQRFSIVTDTRGAGALGLGGQTNTGKGLKARIVSADGAARKGHVSALSGRGARLADVSFSLSEGEHEADVTIELPLELRNQVARLEISGEPSAGATHLLDARTFWQRFGIASGEALEAAQPLLSPTHYIERALSPHGEVTVSSTGNIERDTAALLERRPTVLIFANIGRIVRSSADRLKKWVRNGGVLVRFAGPRLEKGGDTLLPVPLRRGGRSMGGALSWQTPQALAPFEEQSPFYGLAIPDDVKISRQVLADPAAAQHSKAQVWARLEDGTPLVTAARRGDGWLVLLHVSANSDWSNLPMSGLFVEMLRRTAEFAHGAAVGGQDAGSNVDPQAKDEAKTAASALTPTSSHGGLLLAPWQTLDGYGRIGQPPVTANALPSDDAGDFTPDATHPPGYYGKQGQTRALNLIGGETTLKALDVAASGAQAIAYDARKPVMLMPWLLLAALGLFAIDALLTLTLLSGAPLFGWLRRSAMRASVALMALGLAGLAGAVYMSAGLAHAQDTTGAITDFALKSSLHTSLAYVLTGDPATDELSRQGLAGLSRKLTERTAAEPAAPTGVDVERDELVFFPVLYWPVRPNAQPLPDATLAKIDAYMKQGGMIIFDTQDYQAPLGGGLGGQSTALTRLIGKLDTPRLEPVPGNHVLTKSFYLLRSFPGRWDGGALWVEAQGLSEDDGSRRALKSDGVSSILITSNDLAGAWAVGDDGRPLYACVPGGETQREMAYRTGINIVMYALTGNYKADQVHVPALLERLGQ